MARRSGFIETGACGGESGRSEGAWWRRGKEKIGCGSFIGAVVSKIPIWYRTGEMSSLGASAEGGEAAYNPFR